MDSLHHTEQSLDTAVVREALVRCAATPFGAERLAGYGPLAGAAAVAEMFDGVREWLELSEAGDAPSLGGAYDIGDAVRGARKGEILEGSVLVAIGRTLDTMDRVSRALLAEERIDSIPHLGGIAAGIGFDPGLMFDLVAAFEPDGQLSERTYPELGDLRRTIQSIHTTLRSTLTRMAKGEELSDDLQDNFWTVRNDRYVLPLKPHAKARGVVHGTSGSGKTLFVEPHEILELNNRLRVTEGQLAAEERRILMALSRGVGASADEILASQDRILELDMRQARAELARKLDAHPVFVGDQAVVKLLDARHPVLVLRGLDVVGHDLGLDAERPALVLTGPNTGGKTVALKTVGLCAWMVRHAIPLPVQPGSRLDYFDAVLADVGDAQTVTDDLSSFSAQLVAVRGMLDSAGKSTLILLDELASGTDPSQGAALAQAVLEALVDAGARVVTTTHYPPLKGLPSLDSRFAVAAMEVRDGKPTYALLADATGESHALATAARLGLSETILDRARGLLADSDRGVSATLEALDLQRSVLAAEEERIRAARAEVEALQAEVTRRTERLRERATELEKAGAAAYLDRLAKAERAIGAVVAQLQAQPSHKAVKAAKQSLGAFRGLVPAAPAPEPPTLAAPEALRVGDHVRHPTLGSGVIESIGRTIRVRGRAMAFNAKPGSLERIGAPPRAKRPAPPLPPAKPRPVGPLADAMRIQSNTVDLRGMRVDEAIDAVEHGIDRAIAEGVDVIFVLHGHGTGALKSAVRQALRGHTVVKSFAPANVDQGGDAYTVVAVR